jgi:2'-5' RNA ligase
MPASRVNRWTGAMSVRARDRDVPGAFDLQDRWRRAVFVEVDIGVGEIRKHPDFVLFREGHDLFVEVQRDDLSRFLGLCAGLAPEFRWAGADNLHLTLRFMGSVEQPVAEGIADRLQGTLGAAFEVALGEVGTFRRGRLARVVWLGVRTGDGAMRSLAQRVEAECRASGLEPESRSFKPHLTLARARARDGAPTPVLPDLPELEPWRAEELILYSSHLQRAGAVHEAIRTLGLLQ